MIRSKEVMIQSDYPLSGTLTIPKEGNTTFPAALIISGSGKGDRDGNLKRMKMNIYKELAEFLTTKGFVTLRYDKRGTHQSGGDYHKTGVFDLINDATACVKFLQNLSEVEKERILILGHSEGALIAPAVYNKVAVSGLILLSGAAGPSKDLSSFQTEKVFEEMNRTKGIKGWFFKTLKVADKIKKQNEKLYSKVLQSKKDAIRIKGVKLNAKWLRETLDYNVYDYLKDVTCPVLAITGGKDVQVPPEHARWIAETVKGDSEWHVISNMNHILRDYEGEHSMLRLMKEYKSLLDEPLNGELLDKMATWLNKYAYR